MILQPFSGNFDKEAAIKRKMLSLMLVFALVGGFVAKGNASNPQKVLESLKKVQAKVEVGMTYLDYTRELGETNYVMQQGLSNEKNEMFVKAVRKVWDYYMLAKEVWDYKINIRPHLNPTNPQDRQLSIKIYGLLMQVPGMAGAPRDQRGTLSAETALSIIWAAAAKEIHFADQALKGRE